MKRIITTAIAALLGSSLGVAAEDTRPYIFTQAHNNDVEAFTQSVYVGVPLQLQLPAGPLSWTYISDGSKNLLEPQVSEVASPGRIDNTDQVTVFNFKPESPGQLFAIFQPVGLPPNLKPLFPTGRFTLSLEVVQRP